MGEGKGREGGRECMEERMGEGVRKGGKKKVSSE